MNWRMDKGMPPPVVLPPATVGIKIVGVDGTVGGFTVGGRNKVMALFRTVSHDRQLALRQR